MTSTTNLQRRKGGAPDVEAAATTTAATIVPNIGLGTYGYRNTSTTAVRRKRQKRHFYFGSARKLHSVIIFLLVILLGLCILWCGKFISSFFGRDGHGKTESSIIHLPIAGIDIDVPNATEWPLIHIVNTRFMQEQGALEILGMARLHLFFTFCFPTMINQSSQNFFWIIKTDPKFTTTKVFSKLVKAVEEYPNIYIVGSNNNFLIQPGTSGSWRDGSEGMDLLQSKIYTGNITELHQAIALREERPVLETRLDADDGLHMYYIQYIQWVAMRRFQIPLENEPFEDSKKDDDSPPPQWLYWCSRRHIEWHSSLNETETNNTDIDLSFGVLNPIQHSKLCVTPGITVGFNVGVDVQTVPVYSHDQLFAGVANSSACFHISDTTAADDDAAETQPKPLLSPCLDLVEDLLFCALRSRTWTSAGMRNVPLDNRYLPRAELANKLWQLLEKRFSINREDAKKTQYFLMKNQKEIAHENLLGQCTTGHSCKDQAKDELRRYID